MNLKLFKTLTQEQRGIYWESLPLGTTYIESSDKTKGNWWRYEYGELRGHTCESSDGLFIIKSRVPVDCFSSEYAYAEKGQMATAKNYERSVTEQEFNKFIRGLE